MLFVDITLIGHIGKGGGGDQGEANILTEIVKQTFSRVAGKGRGISPGGTSDGLSFLKKTRPQWRNFSSQKHESQTRSSQG